MSSHSFCCNLNSKTLLWMYFFYDTEHSFDKLSEVSPFKNHILCTSQLVCYLWIHWWFHELFMNYSSTTIFDLNIHVDSSSFIIFLVKKIMIMIEIFTAISYIFVDRYCHGCISLIHSHHFFALNTNFEFFILSELKTNKIGVLVNIIQWNYWIKFFPPKYWSGWFLFLRWCLN